MRRKWQYGMRLLAILLVIAFPVGPIRAAEGESLAADSGLISLKELRGQIPERLRMEVTDPEGNAVVVDAPITLPEGGTLPLLMCKRASFDTSDLRKRYPLEKGMPGYVREADAFWNYEGSPVISYYVGQSDRLYGKTDVSARPWLPTGQFPPESDLTPEDILALVHDRIAEFRGDTSADIRIYRIAARGGLHHMKMTKVTDPGSGVSYKMPVADPDRPGKSAGKGAWSLTLTQYFHGVPVFSGSYRPEGESSEGFDPWPMPVWGNMNIVDESLMNLNLGFLREEQALDADAGLLPFPEMERIIAQRIESGQLKSVFGLSLGYSVALVKGDREYGENGKPNMDARYVLLPVWQVRGYDLKDGAGRLFQNGSGPDEQTIMREMSVCYEVRFDAATGEPLKTSQYPLQENGR